METAVFFRLLLKEHECCHFHWGGCQKRAFFRRVRPFISPRLPKETGPVHLRLIYLGRACCEDGGIFCSSWQAWIRRQSLWLQRNQTLKSVQYLEQLMRWESQRSSQAAIIVSPGSPRGRHYLSRMCVFVCSCLSFLLPGACLPPPFSSHSGVSQTPAAPRCHCDFQTQRPEHLCSSGFLQNPQHLLITDLFWCLAHRPRWGYYPNKWLSEVWSNCSAHSSQRLLGPEAAFRCFC